MAIETRDIGNSVVCDICSADFTSRDDKGGFLFGSNGVCPDCAPRMLKEIEKCNETEFIEARCPADMSFREWVLSLRGGDNTVTFMTGQDARDYIR